MTAFAFSHSPLAHSCQSVGDYQHRKGGYFLYLWKHHVELNLSSLTVTGILKALILRISSSLRLPRPRYSSSSDSVLLPASPLLRAILGCRSAGHLFILGCRRAAYLPGHSFIVHCNSDKGKVPTSIHFHLLQASRHPSIDRRHQLGPSLIFFPTHPLPFILQLPSAPLITCWACLWFLSSCCIRDNKLIA